MCETLFGMLSHFIFIIFKGHILLFLFYRRDFWGLRSKRPRPRPHSTFLRKPWFDPSFPTSFRLEVEALRSAIMILVVTFRSFIAEVPLPPQDCLFFISMRKPNTHSVAMISTHGWRSWSYGWSWRHADPETKQDPVAPGQKNLSVSPPTPHPTPVLDWGNRKQASFNFQDFPGVPRGRFKQCWLRKGWDAEIRRGKSRNNTIALGQGPGSPLKGYT